MPHLPWVVEVTRPSLQSSMPVLFDGFCYVPPVTHDYALHIQGEQCDIHFDIDQLDNFYATPSGQSGSFPYSFCSFCIVLFSRYASWLFDIPCCNNTSDSLCGDCNGIYGRNVGR